MFTVALPLALAFIMATLGLGLTGADFRFALRRPRPLLAGVLSQVVLLPLVALALIQLSGLRGELAVGVLILACCPGGITSNVMTKLARGDVALSISFTALASLITSVSLPLILQTTAPLLTDGGLPQVSVAGLSLRMFAMTTIPVVLGVALHRMRPSLALGLERRFTPVANGLFALILLITIISQWSTLMAQLGRLAPLLLLLNLVMLAIGTLVAGAMALPVPQVSTVAIESGFQNGTVGIAVGAVLATATAAATGAGTGPAAALSPYSLPSAVYGVVMMLTIGPYVLWRRSLSHAVTASRLADADSQGSTLRPGSSRETAPGSRSS
ncbi:bile acid:sodium symporter family protein [Synechococcus sp. RSCCF101]|uniref:bile acid:sodium symporter family protein n=1 Tax=Synechococcus sp. RSCCF101 TaxID=2511069 RepID=UPI0012476431|nr:bile acid:sodium symporter family protein [Synechococcus sp. RSCCF101]QEY31485.1 bile acid:sodium symporter family protein [Synechococcus sp. RSCCF101]